MLATVTIEVGYESADQPMKAHAGIQPNKTLYPHGTAGFQTINALIDIRRNTNMLEVVRRCRPTIVGAEIKNLLSDVHFRMLEKESKRLMVSPLKRYDDMYQLKCKIFFDKKTNVSHNLTVTVQAISVPRLENTDW